VLIKTLYIVPTIKKEHGDNENSDFIIIYHIVILSRQMSHMIV